MALPIRGGLSHGDYEVKNSKAAPLSDSSSLIFYYLFDDWYTSYSLVAKKEHQYSAQLDSLVCDPESSCIFCLPLLHNADNGIAQRNV